MSRTRWITQCAAGVLAAGVLGGCATFEASGPPGGRAPSRKPGDAVESAPAAPHLPYDYYNPNASPPNDPALLFFTDGT